MRPFTRSLVTFVAGGALVAGVGVALAAPLPDPPAPHPLPRIAFVARNDLPFDSLAAGPVAAMLGAPIFITSPQLPLSDAARFGLLEFGPEVVIIAGGPAAISADVENAIRDTCGCGVARAEGVGRDETANAIADVKMLYGIGRPLVTGAQVEGDAYLGGALNVDELAVQRGGTIGGSLGIGTDLDVDGDAAAASFTTTDRVPGAAGCSASNFDPHSYLTNFDETSASPDAAAYRYNNTGSTATFTCSLAVPVGARLDTLTVGLFDDSTSITTGPCTAQYRPLIGAAQTLATVPGTTPASAEPGYIVMEASLNGAEVDLSQGVVVVTCDVNSDYVLVGITGAIVTYTVPGVRAG